MLYLISPTESDWFCSPGQLAPSSHEVLPGEALTTCPAGDELPGWGTTEEPLQPAHRVGMNACNACSTSKQRGGATVVPFTGPVCLSLEEFLAREPAVQPTVASICSSKFHLAGAKGALTEYTVLHIPGFQGLPCSTREASTSTGFTKGPETYTWPTQDPCPRGGGGGV